MKVIGLKSRRKEYLTVGATVEELRSYDKMLRAAGFKKRYGASGQSPATKEFYQWWDKTMKNNNNAKQQSQREASRRSGGLCIKCGERAAPSTRKNANGSSQYCVAHLVAHREYQRTRFNYKRRNSGSASYRIQQAGK